MLAGDLADGAALAAHDDRVRGGTLRCIAHALEQLTIGDAGGAEEDVVTGDEVARGEDAGQVVAGVERLGALGSALRRRR